MGRKRTLASRDIFTLMSRVPDATPRAKRLRRIAAESHTWAEAICLDKYHTGRFERTSQQPQIALRDRGRTVCGFRSPDRVDGEPRLISQFRDRQIEQTAGRSQLRACDQKHLPY